MPESPLRSSSSPNVGLRQTGGTDLCSARALSGGAARSLPLGRQVDRPGAGGPVRLGSGQ